MGAFNEDEDANEQNTIHISGSAYIFYRNQGGTNNWGMQKKITAPQRNGGDYYGVAVDISGDYAIVGAYGDSEDAKEQNKIPNSGSAYIYYRNKDVDNNWGIHKKITATNRAYEDLFGNSVAISGDYSIVGAVEEDEDSNEENTILNSGSVYFVERREDLYYQSDSTNVSFNSAEGWQTSPDGINWSNAISPPNSIESKLAIIIRSGHTATVSSNITLDLLTIENGGNIVINENNRLTVVNEPGIDLEIQGTGSITGAGSFRLLTGATLRTSHIDGFNAINVNGSKTFGLGANYEFNGTSQQTINNPRGIEVNNFTIKNALGGKLSNDIIINGTLATSLGDLDLNGYNVNLTYYGILSENLALNHIVTDNTATGESSQGGGIIFKGKVTNIGTDIKGTGLWLQRNAGNDYFVNVIRKHYKADSRIFKLVYQITSASTNTNTTMRIYYPAEENLGTTSGFRLFRWESAETGWKNASDNEAGFTDGSASADYVEATGINEFSHWTVGSNNASLSIKLLDLKGKRLDGLSGKKTNEVKITWTTASEINNKGFEVEMSTDGIAYEKIGYIESKDNSTSVISYELVVKNADASYYRLKQYNFDGSFSYSPIIFVKSLEGNVAIYPNPVKDVLTISLDGNTQKEVAVTLFDDQGKYYLQRNLALKAGKALLNLKNIQKSGLYFLRMQIGKDWIMEKVLIEK